MTRWLAGVVMIFALSFHGCGGGPESRSPAAPSPEAPSPEARAPEAPAPAAPAPHRPSDLNGELTGVYDLDAPITSSDPAWGSTTGWREVAVLNIEQAANASQFTGTFAQFRAIEPGGEPDEEGSAGTIKGSITREGRIVIDLSFEDGRLGWYGEGALASGQIVGRYGFAGHISGTFTAKRR